MEDAPSRILVAILDYNFFPALLTALVNCCSNLSFPFICYEDAVLPCAVFCMPAAAQGAPCYCMGPQWLHP